MLDGGPGNDVQRGGAGGDRIIGGRGNDTIFAGSGNDVISARDGERDIVYCGRGSRDRVVADKLDKVARNCERVVRR